VAGQPPATRFAWAERVLGLRGLSAPEPVAGSTFTRASRVPPRAVLATGLADRLGLPRIDWRAELEHYAGPLEPVA
jgi:hypothetical protein